MHNEKNSTNLLHVTLHIGVLWALAIAQPLYSVLSQNAEFFVAHNSSGSGILAIVIALSLALPGAISLLIAAVHSFSRLQSILTFSIVAILATLAILPPLKTMVFLEWQATIGFALFFGFATAFVYYRYAGIKLWLILFSPVIILFPALFAFDSPVNKLLFNNSTDQILALESNNQPPIVIVILDEMGTAALMDEDLQIDEIRFPNFAKLAASATWYRNATTTQLATTQVVPAILTGRFPYADNKKRLPTAQEYPHSIFTWLAGSYPLNVSEKVTSLCAEILCSSGSDDRSKNFYEIFRDMAFVYLHIILPEELAWLLPDISANWSGFGAPRQIASLKDAARNSSQPAGEAARFEQFINQITQNNAKGLHLIHSLLPHVPYKYLPNGLVYSHANGLPAGVTGRIWDENPPLVEHVYHRYLLQTGYVDTLLGKLLTHLQELNIYDEALIIVTADHGVSFHAGQFRRQLTATNFPDLLPVPLLVKLPGQQEAIIDERYVSNLDIMPTIADVLGAELPWQADGFSLLSSKNREQIIVPFLGKKGPRVFDTKTTLQFPSLARKLKLFGAHTSFDTDIRKSKFSNLIGVVANDRMLAKGLQLVIQNHLIYQYVDASSGYIPAMLSGEVIHNGHSIQTDNLDLAISVNGIISSIVTTSEHLGKPQYFSTMIHQNALKSGANDIKVYLIQPSPTGEPQLLQIPTYIEQAQIFQIETSSAGESELVDARGDNIVLSTDFRGVLDSVKIVDYLAFFSGWAVDELNGEPVDRIYILIGEEVIFSGRSNLPRQDVANYFKNQELKYCGYKYEVPVAILQKLLAKKVDLSTLQILATSKGGKVGKLNIGVNVVSDMLNALKVHTGEH